MDYRGIKTLGTISGVMSLIVLGFDIWSKVFMAHSASSASGWSTWCAFLFVGLLDNRVGAVLESQAAEITELKRQLAERHSPAV